MPPCGGHLLPVGDHLHQNGFKSCPRVGGIHGVRKLLQGDGVSSRAPVWGASAVSVMFGIVEEVSSRAPVWGASIGKGGYTKCQKSFKSCPRVGGIYKVKFAIPDEN